MHLNSFYNMLLILLFSIKIIFGQNTPSVPCRKIFRYNLDDDKWFGVIRLKEVRYDEHLKLSVDMSLLSGHKSSPLRSVDLKIIREEEANAELIIKFPIPSVLPKLTKIELNDEVICSGPSEQSTDGNVIFETNMQGVKAEAFTNKNNQQKNNVANYPYIDSASRFFGNNSCGELAGKFKYEPVDYSTGIIEHGAWPWMAAVYKKYFDYQGFAYTCTGTLISTRAVITSESCTANTDGPKYYIVYLGMHSLMNLEDEKGIKSTIYKIHTHPSGRKPSYRAYADISILELTDHIQYTDFIRPACIWTESTLLADVVGEVGFVAGWGEEYQQQDYNAPPIKARAPIVSLEECRTSFYESSPPDQWILDHTLCAGERSYEGPCQRDEGAGLLLRKGSKWILRAVVSQIHISNGSQSCNLEKYVIYNDIAQYLDWIEGVSHYITDLSEYAKARSSSV